MPDNTTKTPAVSLQDQEDVDFVIELLDDFAVQCRILAAAARSGLPLRPALCAFDGAWLLMRTMVESLDRKDDWDSGRQGALILSADIIRQLKQVRREVFVDGGE